MTREQVFDFLSQQRLAVVSANCGTGGAPQSAVVGVAVTRDFQFVFDTVKTSRKYANLLANPACSLTIWDGEITVQYEGVAHEVDISNQEKYREIYFASFPDGRDRLH